MVNVTSSPGIKVATPSTIFEQEAFTIPSPFTTILKFIGSRFCVVSSVCDEVIVVSVVTTVVEVEEEVLVEVVVVVIEAPVNVAEIVAFEFGVYVYVLLTS